MCSSMTDHGSLKNKIEMGKFLSMHEGHKKIRYQKTMQTSQRSLTICNMKVCIDDVEHLFIAS